MEKRSTLQRLTSRSEREWTAAGEAQLLLAVCQTFIGSLDEKKLIGYLQRPIDEREFLRLCQNHRLILLVNKVLIEPYPQHFSEATLAAFARITRKLTASHLMQSKVAVDLHRELSARSIPHVFLKGPVLGEMLFPGQLLRYSSDLDLLVNRKDLLESEACLRRLGFAPECEEDLPERRSRFSLLSKRDLAYRRKDFPHAVELHWKTHQIEALVNNEGFHLPSQIVFQPFHNEQMPVLESQLNCIYLCFHAAQHNWSRLRWLMDIAVLLPRKNLRWRGLFETADRFHLKSAVEEAAVLMRDVLAVPNHEIDGLSKRAEARIRRRFALANDPGRTKLGTLEMFLKKGFLYSSPSLRVVAWSYNVWILVFGLLLKIVERVKVKSRRGQCLE